MPKSWDALAESNPYNYQLSHFQAAAYQLVSEQTLYRSVSAQRVSYELIARYRPEYQEAMALLGIELKWDDNYRFVAAIPRQMKHVAMTRQLTLLALVVRQCYHDQMQAGTTDEGCATLTIEQLLDAYKALAKREDLPTTSGALKDAVRPLQRFGMIRIDDVDTPAGPTWQLAILPGVAELISEPVLVRLASAWTGAGTAAEPDDSESQRAATEVSA